MAQHQLAVRRWIDTCGFPKDTYFYYQAWWTAKPVLHIFPHWNWPGFEGKLIAVWVHTNMDRVELFQDGKSLGIKDVPKDSHVAWNVSYQPGTLEARGFKGGQQVMVARRETVGNAAKLAITTDRSQGSPQMAKTSPSAPWRSRTSRVGCCQSPIRR